MRFRAAGQSRQLPACDRHGGISLVDPRNAQITTHPVKGRSPGHDNNSLILGDEPCAALCLRRQLPDGWSTSELGQRVDIR